MTGGFLYMNAPRCVGGRSYNCSALCREARPPGGPQLPRGKNRLAIGQHTRGAFAAPSSRWDVAHPVAGQGAHRPRLLAAPSAQRAVLQHAQPRSTLTGAHLRLGPRGSLPRAWPTPAPQRAHRPPALPAGRNGGWAGPPRWSSVLVARLCCRLPAARGAPLYMYLTLLAVVPAQAIGWQMASTARTRA